MVLVSGWLTHLELDSRLPSRRALIERLAPNHRVVRDDAMLPGEPALQRYLKEIDKFLRR